MITKQLLTNDFFQIPSLRTAGTYIEIFKHILLILEVKTHILNPINLCHSPIAPKKTGFLRRKQKGNVCWHISPTTENNIIF